MRRVLAAGAMVALVSTVLVLQPTGDAPARADVGGGGNQGIGWQYHESSGSYWQKPEGTPGGGGSNLRPTKYTHWGEPNMVDYECPAEPYDGSPFEDCGEVSYAFCNSSPGPNNRPVAPMVVWERDFPDDNPDTPEVQEGEPSPWRPAPGQEDQEPAPPHAIPFCMELPEENVVTKEEVHEVNYEIFQDLRGLDIQVQPDQDNKTLVNFNTIVYTDYPANVAQIPEVEDFDPEPKPRIVIRGEVDGKVEQFEYIIRAEADLLWTFQDGAPGKAKGRGHEFNGTLPDQAPADYYVLANFVRTGTKDIALGAQWTGTVEVTSPGDPGPHPMDPVDIAAVHEQVQVVEKLNILGY